MQDATTGATVNLRDRFLPAITKMNYWMCEYARQKGFQCADSFAQYMGADVAKFTEGSSSSMLSPWLTSISRAPTFYLARR